MLLYYSVLSPNDLHGVINTRVCHHYEWLDWNAVGDASLFRYSMYSMYSMYSQ